MRQLRIPMLGLLLLALFSLGQAQPGSEEKPVIMVAEVKLVGLPNPQNLQASILNRIISAVNATGQYQTTDPEATKRAMQKAGEYLAKGDCYSFETCKGVHEVGKALGATLMITGTVTWYPDDQFYDLSLKLTHIFLFTNPASISLSSQGKSTQNLFAAVEQATFQLLGAPQAGMPASQTEEKTGGQAFLPVATTQGTGSLSIATEPAGAEIYLDAELKGKTPTTLSSVPAGSHSLSLMKKGYSPLMKEVVVKANTTTPVSERLLKQTGALEITTTPTGAQIFVDDKFQGASPKKVEGVLTGKHKVKAQLENYSAAEQEVSVDYQQTTPVAIELGGLPGKILLTSIPEGAEVKIDGEKKGVTTYTGSLPVGKHRVEVSQEGYDRVQEEVEVAPNKAISKSYTLKKYSGPVAGEETHPQGTKGGPMVFVPAGEFWMGCNDRVDKECSDDEKPYHKVYLDAYYIDKFEVTQGEYSECVRAGKRKGGCQDNSKNDGFTSERQPVVGVTWDQAKAYCEWAGKHLPTEAQWEKAARGTDGRKYPWGNQFEGTKLNFCDQNCDQSWADKSVNDGFAKTAPVGSYAQGASPYGALDMAGNVWEWVADWYDKGYYSGSPERNPTGTSSGTYRVLRGGCWDDFAGGVRASRRFYSEPTVQSDYLGFRCVGD